MLLAGGQLFGLQFKDVLLVALVIAWITYSYFAQRQERKLIADFKTHTPQVQARIVKALGREALPFLHKANDTFRTDWRWAAVNIASAFLLIGGFPLGYSLLSDRPVTASASFTAWHLLAMFAGFGCWSLIRRYRAHIYRCPTCATALCPTPTKKLHFECARCNKLWYALDQNKWV